MRIEGKIKTRDKGNGMRKAEKIRGVFISVLIIVFAAAKIFAGDVITWVPSYSIAECKTMLQTDFGGVGMEDGLTYLALQFWKPKGPDIDKFADDSDIEWFRDWGQSRGIKVTLCVYNYIDGWNWPEATRAYIDNKDAFINSIVAEIERLGLDGVEIDLEGPDVPDSERDAFYDFCQALVDTLHPMGKVVTAASFAARWNAPNWDWWPTLLPMIDAVTSMGYDYSGMDKDYQDQVDHASAAPEKFMIGMPGWADTWQDNYVTDQIDWVINQGQVGVGIWDCALSDGGWKTAEVWNRLAQIVGESGSGPYTLTVNVQNGTVEVSPQQQEYEEGTEVTLTALPDQDYIFSGWEGGASGMNEETVITINDNTSVTANFAYTGELISNGDFSQGEQDWTFETSSATAQGSVTDGAFSIDITQSGTEAWNIQLRQEGFSIVNGQQYVLSFRAWADASCDLLVNAGESQDPWVRYLDESEYNAALTTEPQEYSVVFTMSEPTDNNARIEFNAGLTGESLYLDDVSLKIHDATPVSFRGTASKTLPAAVKDIDLRSGNIILQVLKKGRLSLRILGLNGRELVSKKAQDVNAGRNIVSFDKGAVIPAGAYLIVVKGNGWSVKKKVLNVK